MENLTRIIVAVNETSKALFLPVVIGGSIILMAQGIALKDRNSQIEKDSVKVYRSDSLKKDSYPEGQLNPEIYNEATREAAQGNSGNTSGPNYEAGSRIIESMFGGSISNESTYQEPNNAPASSGALMGICGQVAREQIGWKHRFEVTKSNGEVVEATFAGNPNHFTIIPQWGKRFGCDEAVGYQQIK